MIRFRAAWWIFAGSLLVAGPLSAGTFFDRLTPEQKRRMGIDRLAPAQLAELAAAIEQYRKDSADAAAQQAAATAVERYKKKEEPGVVSRALDLFRRQQDEAKQERFTATLSGKFSGWEGRTLFVLDNGQVWRQDGSEIYSVPPAQNVPVLLYKARSGRWRLQLIEEGAWVTVTRVK